MVVVAHPDDESVACAVLLQRMRSPVLVFMTDGAPDNPDFWGRPYASRAEYADVRRKEAKSALSEIAKVEVEEVGIADQAVWRNLQVALEQLQKLAERYRPEVILTHAYEGGHPDHDCCSFLCSIVGRRSKSAVWEMPLYHRATGELFRQQFLPRDDAPARAALVATGEERYRKQKMILAYGSQFDFIKQFEVDVEQFRPQPAYDFTRPPHAGVLNYEAWGWSMSGEDLCAAFRRVLQQRLGEEAA